MKVKILVSVTLFLLTGFTAAAQTNDSAAKNLLLYYNAPVKSNPDPTYTKIHYTRPNNQLMSWPNYPLTAAQIAQRDRNWKQENKVSSRVAKDIITSFLSKKKPVAVIPKF